MSEPASEDFAPFHIGRAAALVSCANTTLISCASVAELQLARTLLESAILSIQNSIDLADQQVIQVRPKDLPSA